MDQKFSKESISTCKMKKGKAMVLLIAKIEPRFRSGYQMCYINLRLNLITWHGLIIRKMTQKIFKFVPSGIDRLQKNIAQTLKWKLEPKKSQLPNKYT